jgi:hypothetical protein
LDQPPLERIGNGRQGSKPNDRARKDPSLGIDELMFRYFELLIIRA